MKFFNTFANYLDFYLKDSDKWSKQNKKAYRLFKTKNGYKLTIDERKRILLHHIYGVDIDKQAVEVTKLSLLLKVLEDETEQSIDKQRRLFNERALPDLASNIKCGNSLIGKDFYDNKSIDKFNDSEITNLNVFDWNDEYPEIMRCGGFDIVINNPPYVFTRDQGFTLNEKDYFQKNYTLCSYQLNSFVLFIEQSYRLLKKKGQIGFITPNNWLTLDMNYKLREFVLNQMAKIKIINLDGQIFEGANVDTCIFTAQKDKDNYITYGDWIKTGYDKNYVELSVYPSIQKETISAPRFYFQISKAKSSIDFKEVLLKIQKCGSQLRDLACIKAGVEVYGIGSGIPAQTLATKKNRLYHSRASHDEHWHKYLDGENVSRYYLTWNEEYVKYGKNLRRRCKESFFESPRVLVRQIPNKPPYCIHATYVEEKIINDRNSMIILQDDQNFDLKYILGVINSKPISYWFYYYFDKFQRKTFPQFKISELEFFPIPKIAPDLQKPIIELVDKAIELHNSCNMAGLTLKPILIDQINKTNKKIDEHVYDLFRLTKKEIQIIESDYYAKTV